MIANTAASNGQAESANASILDTVKVTGSDGTSGFYNLFSTGQNGVSSSGGLGNQAITNTAAIDYTGFALTSGVSYTIALQSTANEVIVPGSSVTPVPEPGSLLLLGTGLLGLALVSRKRIKKI